MKKLLFLFLLFGGIFQCNAQKEAFNWIWGICTAGDSCNLPYSVSIIKFGSDSIERVYSPNNFGGSFYAGTATMSDSLGNFLMAFDGKFLYDSVGNTIAELTNQNYGSITAPINSFTFLRLKNDKENYYLIYNYSKFLTTPVGLLTIADDDIIKLKINVSNENGIQFISADTIRYNEFVYPGGNVYNRHANGRDWWILKSGFRRNSFLRGILSPEGLTFEDFKTDADSMYNNAQIWHAMSSDGTKFFHFMGNSIRILDVYDFDRCTGELSNLRSFDFSELLHPDDFNPFNLSPDGNTLYFRRGNVETFQGFKNLVFNINNNEFHEINYSMNTPCLAPNLKQMVFGHYIYYDNGTFNTFLSVLNEPNEYNEANLDTFAYVMPTWGYLRVPHNWANHMLGPVDGSSCDTLGLDQDYTWLPKVPEVSFVIYPNPGQSELNFRTDMPLPINLTITDAQGKLVLQQQFNKSSFTLSNEIAALQQGIYFVELRNNEKGIRASKKWMKIP